MALITCSECQNQVSSFAAVCPKCGCPVATHETAQVAPQNVGPNLPEDLSLGDKDFQWLTPDRFSGQSSAQSTIPGLAVGEHVIVTRMNGGISMYGIGNGFVSVHYSQIASVEFIEAAKVKEEKKSVIGRALLGGVLLGPVGAIVGGISGAGSNQKVTDGISITFWSIPQQKYVSLVLEKESKVTRDFARSLKEKIKPYESLHFDTAV